MTGVLILHNSLGSPDDPLYASRAGVMDQVGAVEQALDSVGLHFEVIAIDDLPHLVQVVKSRRESLIFNLVEEFSSSIEQANYVPALCRAFGKSCTGNDTPTLLQAQNKGQAKSLLQAAGLPCPEGIEIPPGESWDSTRLSSGRYIMKPAWNDASEGISSDSVFELPAEAARAGNLAADLHRRFRQPVILERFIPKGELNVSLLERNGRIDVLPVAEIDFSAFDGDKPRIVDYSAKWDEGSFSYLNTPRRIPAELDPNTRQKVEKLASAAWKTLNCRDYARVDFRLDEGNLPYILEINPNPDISPDAGFAAALQAANISYQDFVRDMLANAQRRLGSSNPPIQNHQENRHEE